MAETILKAEHMFKEFGATKAVTDVTISLHKGTGLGLVGENGSGKSTLSSMIAGVYPPTKGEMTYKGKEYKPGSVLEARKAGIQYLTQEQGTIDGMTVAENMFLGEEDSFGKGGMVNMRRLIARAKEILDENNRLGFGCLFCVRCIWSRLDERQLVCGRKLEGRCSS